MWFWLRLLFSCVILSSCQHLSAPRPNIAVQASRADSLMRNQLIRQLVQHGYDVKPNAAVCIKLIEAKLTQIPALSGSDNIVKNDWLTLTLRYQINRGQHNGAIQTLFETHLLRQNYNLTLFTQHQRRFLQQRLRSRLAERIIHKLPTKAVDA